MKTLERIQMIVLRVSQTFGAIVNIEQDRIIGSRSAVDQLTDIRTFYPNAFVGQGMPGAPAKNIMIPLHNARHEFSNHYLCMRRQTPKSRRQSESHAQTADENLRGLLIAQ